jgi:hypothetical protein
MADSISVLIWEIDRDDGTTSPPITFYGLLMVLSICPALGRI